MTKKCEQNLIVLFDEFGTPSFKTPHGSGIFLGVSVLYKSKDQQTIFDYFDSLMGLSKSKPLKNDKISADKAVKIARALGKNEINIFSEYVDLKDQNLENVITNYELFGNMSRRLYRGIEKERKQAHILHTQLMESCLSDVVLELEYIETNVASSYIIEPFIDNWSYPLTDQYIVTDYASERLQNKMNKIISEIYRRESKIIVKPKILLDNPSDKRKRFIDVVVSVISRAFLNASNPKYDPLLLQELKKSLGSKIIVKDISSEVAVLLNNAMYDEIQETKTRDEQLILPK
jgi:hypothetical protein